MLLTTKTNVPRNSARNSLSIPCLSAQCCLMLLLVFVSCVASCCKNYEKSSSVKL